jgi:hypothetical protein
MFINRLFKVVSDKIMKVTSNVFSLLSRFNRDGQYRFKNLEK